MTPVTDRGHRVAAHTADQIVEAWGPSRAACLEEAVAGLVGSFAEDLPTAGSQATTVTLTGEDDAQLLLAVLDEVVYRLDADNLVPVATDIDDHGATVELRCHLVDAAEVQPVGPAPKGIAHSGLTLTTDGDQWTARALVDI